MESEKKSIENLLVSIENYSKTSIDLLTLRFADKTSGILSKLITHFILIVTLSFFLILLSIGIAMWIGDALDATYLGFLIVAAFYGILGISCMIAFPKIIARIKNSIISQMLN